jgi:tetratricopeptide (TPR) repeat protein
MAPPSHSANLSRESRNLRRCVWRWAGEACQGQKRQTADGIKSGACVYGKQPGEMVHNLTISGALLQAFRLLRDDGSLGALTSTAMTTGLLKLRDYLSQLFLWSCLCYLYYSNNIVGDYDLARTTFLLLMISLLGSTAHVIAVEEQSDFARGLALRMEGKNAQAVEAFGKVPADSPEYVRALVQKGAALEDMGKKREASNTYERALKIDPKNPSAARNLDQLNSVGTTESAIQAPNPAKEDLLRSGLRALEAGDFKKALEVFRLSRGLLPNDPRPLFYSALTMEFQGNLRGAISLYERTIESFPDHIPARINHVLAFLATGDREAAMKHCRKALDNSPENRRLRSLADLLSRVAVSTADTALNGKGSKGP